MGRGLRLVASALFSSLMKYSYSFFGVWQLAAFLLLCFAGSVARAQAPAWQMAVAARGNESHITATAADASGNVYVAGDFYGTLVLGNLTLTSVGDGDAFVAKWSTATNSFIWARRAGGPGLDQAYGVAVSGANVYVAGSFVGAADFGTTTLTSSTANYDAFVAKLTDVGPGTGFVWAQRVGGAGSDVIQGIAVSGANVYVAGSFAGTADFGATTLVSAGGYDTFVAKLADAGPGASFTWAERAGGPAAFEGATGVAVSGANVYVVGVFSGTAGFGATALVGAGSDDAFVTKLTDAGTSASFVWAQRVGGAGYEFARGVAVSGANVYMVGTFGGTLVLGPATLVCIGDLDAFVVRLTDAGPSASLTWARRAGGAGSDNAYGVAVSGADVYVVGDFLATADFGATTLVSVGGQDAFVAKLTDVGPGTDFAWAQRAGGQQVRSDGAYAVAVAGGNVYVAGTIRPPASFGPFTFATPTNTFVGFLASLRGSVLATRPAGPLASLSLWPNPARAAAAVQVQVPAVPGATRATLTLLDALGRTVRTQRLALAVAGGRAEVSVAGLAPGLYRLLVQADGQQANRALVVE